MGAICLSINKCKCLMATHDLMNKIIRVFCVPWDWSVGVKPWSGSKFLLMGAICESSFFLQSHVMSQNDNTWHVFCYSGISAIPDMSTLHDIGENLISCNRFVPQIWTMHESMRYYANSHSELNCWFLRTIPA